MFQYGEQILNMAVLSIVISAPLGAVLILATGPLLLHSDLEVKGSTDEGSDLEEAEMEEEGQEEDAEERVEEDAEERVEEDAEEREEEEEGVEENTNKSLKNDSKMLNNEMESVELCQGDLSVDNTKIIKEHLS